MGGRGRGIGDSVMEFGGIMINDSGRGEGAAPMLDMGVTIRWTGLLDWNTGLDYWTHP
jgi:hypothetical protein